MREEGNARQERGDWGVSLGDFLMEVERGLVEELGLDGGDYRASHILSDASKYLMVSAWSKRVRPRLVYGFGEAMGLEPMGLVGLAMAVEGVHTASLMHDDVVDEGELRRGQPTVNARWGNLVAILGGDLLLSRSMKALDPYGRDVVLEGIRVVEEMTQATMMEIDARGRLDLRREEWQQIAKGKTGVLLAFCGRGPAYCANRHDLLDELSLFGYHFGMAFQLADDLKDLITDAGKDRFADIREKNPSFVHILAREKESRLFSLFQETWSHPVVSPESAERLGQQIVNTGIIEDVKQIILEHLEQAYAATNLLIRGEGGGTLAHLLKNIVTTV